MTTFPIYAHLSCRTLFVTELLPLSQSHYPSRHHHFNTAVPGKPISYFPVILHIKYRQICVFSCFQTSLSVLHPQRARGVDRCSSNRLCRTSSSCGCMPVTSQMACSAWAKCRDYNRWPAPPAHQRRSAAAHRETLCAQENNLLLAAGPPPSLRAPAAKYPPAARNPCDQTTRADAPAAA